MIAPITLDTVITSGRNALTDNAAAAPLATKSDLAYLRVRDLILSGELAPGSVLNQATLARAIGISTTPLREALRRLKQQGLVELDAHRDARVARLDAEEARDLLELRLSLDPLAASLAAQRRTSQDVAEMRAALAGLESLPTEPTARQLAAHREFHSTIYRASHNARLVDTLDDLWDAADRYRRHGLQIERTAEEREAKAREHALLFDAIVEGDGATAEEVMRTHIRTSTGARAAWQLAATDAAERR
jgi:DNA-binding GntR family transcriptional regulator